VGTDGAGTLDDEGVAYEDYLDSYFLFTFFGVMVIQGELVQPDEVNNVGICLVCANLMASSSLAGSISRNMNRRGPVRAR
jgi:hypothetical protein